MPTGLYALVEAPAAVAPRGPTLLRSARVLEEADPRWQQGITWRPVLCGDSDIVKVMDACNGFAGFDTPDVAPTTPQYNPPHVAVGMACDGLSGDTVLRETMDMAAALLDRCQTLGIARELWRGDAAVSATPDLPNLWLAESSGMTQPKGSTAQGVIRALAEMEAALALEACAGANTIHVSPRTSTYWKLNGLVDRQPDGRLLTGLGSLVIADPGYDGSAPDGTTDATGDTAWIYGTGPVDVRLGPVQVTPAAQMGTLNRLNNNFSVFAHRAFSATFDPCARVGIRVSHTTLT